MWQVIPYIATPLAAFAFIAAVVGWVVRHNLALRYEALKDLPPEERLNGLRDLTGNISPDREPNEIEPRLKAYEDRAKKSLVRFKWMIVSGSICFLAVLVAIVVVSFARPADPKETERPTQPPEQPKYVKVPDGELSRTFPDGGNWLHEIIGKPYSSEAIKDLLSRGVDRDKTDNEGRTPLTRAIELPDVEAITTLIENHARVRPEDLCYFIVKSNDKALGQALKKEIDPNSKTQKNELPIVLAVTRDNANAVKLLLEHKAKPTLTAELPGPNKVDNTTAFEQVIANQQDHLLRMILDFHPELSNWIRPSDQSTTLHIVCNLNLHRPSKEAEYQARLAQQRNTVSMLLDKDANPNAQNTLGNTPLHNAAKMSDGNLVSLLLKRGASVDTQNKKGETSLFTAISRPSYVTQIELIIQELLDNKANPDIPNNEGCTPLLWTMGKISLFGGTTIEPTKHLPNVIRLLLDKNADPNRVCPKIGKTPLQYAVIDPTPEVALCLLSHKADVDLKTEKYPTPLHTLFLQRNRLTLWTATPARLELLKILLSYHPKLTEKDINGNTPLDLAKIYKWKEGIELLEKASHGNFPKIEQRCQTILDSMARPNKTASPLERQIPGKSQGKGTYR
jgi:ankyrin repeat protein